MGLVLKYTVWSKNPNCICTNTVGFKWAENRGTFASLNTSGWIERRVPFQKHVGQLSLSPLCHWERTALNHIPVIVILIRSQKKRGGAKRKKRMCGVHAHIHSPTVEELICSMNARRGKVVRWQGNRVRAAMCEIEALMVLQGFSQGVGWNGTIIKRTGGREEASSAFTRSRREDILRAPLHSPSSSATVCTWQLCTWKQSHKQKELLWQLQLTVYALQR